MERTRTSKRNLVELTEVFIEYDGPKVSVMGEVKEERELFGCKVYTLENLPPNKIFMIDSRGKGTVLTLTEEERLRLIRED
jgi:hypothetical protein